MNTENKIGELVAKMNEANAVKAKASEALEAVKRDWEAVDFKAERAKSPDSAQAIWKAYDDKQHKAREAVERAELIAAYWRECFAAALMVDAAEVYAATLPKFTGKPCGAKTREKFEAQIGEGLARLGYGQERYSREDGETKRRAPWVYLEGCSYSCERSKVSIKAENVGIWLYGQNLEGHFDYLVNKDNKFTDKLLNATPARLPVDRFPTAEAFADAFMAARAKLNTLREQFKRDADELYENVKFGYISLESVRVEMSTAARINR